MEQPADRLSPPGSSSIESLPIDSLDLAARRNAAPAFISRGNAGHTLVVRWSGYQRYTPDQNAAYAAAMHTNVDQAAQELFSGSIADAKQLWERARSARANSLAGPDLSPSRQQGFSEERWSAMRTTLKVHGDGDPGEFSDHTPSNHRRYGYIVPELERRLERVVKASAMPVDSGSLSRLAASSTESGAYTLKASRDPAEPYELQVGHETHYYPRHVEPQVRYTFDAARRQNPNGKPIYEVTSATMINPMEPESFAMSPPEGLPRISWQDTLFRRMTQLYQHALNSDDHAAVNSALEAYWISIRSAIDDKGSAAKSHFSLQAFLQSRGIELPPQRQGVSLDLEAMIRPLDEWLATARTFFDTASTIP